MHIDRAAIEKSIKDEINRQVKAGRKMPPDEDKEIMDLGRITDAVIEAINGSQPAPEPNKTTN